MRMAGTALAALAGAGAGIGAMELARYLDVQRTPEHSRAMTQDEHARNNIGDIQQRHPGLTDMEMALYEGIRQGLMAGVITGSEVNVLAKEGKLPENVMALLTDVHDWTSDEPYPFGDKTIAEATPWDGLKG